MIIEDGADVLLINNNTTNWSLVDDISIGASTLTTNSLVSAYSRLTLNSKDTKLVFNHSCFYRLEVITQDEGCSTSQFIIPSGVFFHEDSYMLFNSLLDGEQLTNGSSYYLGHTFDPMVP